jgi:hypothetical protein
MSFSLPPILDPVWRQFADSCMVITLCNQGTASDQLQESFGARANPARLFVPVKDENRQFRRFHFDTEQEPLTLIGTWFKGTTGEVSSIIDRAREKWVWIRERQKIVGEVRGKLVFLALSYHAADKNR